MVRVHDGFDIVVPFLLLQKLQLFKHLFLQYNRFVFQGGAI